MQNTFVYLCLRVLMVETPENFCVRAKDGLALFTDSVNLFILCVDTCVLKPINILLFEKCIWRSCLFSTPLHAFFY